MSEPTDRTATRGTRHHYTIVLGVILASYLMIVLDISIVITGLPQIQGELGFSDAGLSWVQTAYTLTFGGLLLLGARIGDVYGRRRMFVIGIAVFAVASLGVALAFSPAAMLIARVLQGVGAAIVAPATLALISTEVPGEKRARAISAYGATAGIGAAVGLVLGGILATTLSWRVGFLINLPLGVAMVLAARRHLTETPRRSERFDLAGAALSITGTTALVYGIVRAADAGWADPYTVAALAVGVVLLATFTLVERRAAHPILPLRLLSHRVRVGAYTARMLFAGAMFGYFFFTTQLLQGVLGFSALEAGLAFLPMSIVNFATAMLVPRWSRRVGNGTVLCAALIVAAAGMVWLGQADTATTYLSGVAVPLLLIGIGQGAGLAPLTTAGLAAVRRDDAGAGGGLINVTHQIGGSLGLAVMVTASVAFSDSSGDTDPGVLVERIGTAMTTGAIMLGIALVLTVALIVPATWGTRTTVPTERRSPARARAVPAHTGTAAR